MKKLFEIKVIKFVYLIVFSSLAFWSIFAYISINELINEQKIYAKLINISGKQRMLSQKTTLFAKRSFETNDKIINEHFLELINTMKNDHAYILKNLTSDNIKNIYLNEPYNLAFQVENYLSFLENFSKNKDIQVLKKIENTSFLLLPVLNHAVYAFEEEITQKTNELQRRELLILIGALLTLLLEAVFIVIPSVRSSERSLKLLIRSKEELEHKVEEKVKSIKEKDELLYHQSKVITVNKLIDNIAHYWRQPLSVITTSATGILIKKEYKQLSDEDLELNLRSIVDNSMYLSNIIEKYRALFELKKEKEYFDTYKAHKKIIELISNKTTEHNIKIVNKVEDFSFYGFENDLILVLSYIYENAIEIFIERNLKDKFIFTMFTKLDDKLVISIKDSAGGIDPQIINKVFDPYFSTKDKKIGTGIDLYVAKQILKDRFNGSIEVKNTTYEYDKLQLSGAEFVIKIPLS